MSLHFHGQRPASSSSLSPISPDHPDCLFCSSPVPFPDGEALASTSNTSQAGVFAGRQVSQVQEGGRLALPRKRPRQESADGPSLGRRRPRGTRNLESVQDPKVREVHQYFTEVGTKKDLALTQQRRTRIDSCAGLIQRLASLPDADVCKSQLLDAAEKFVNRLPNHVDLAALTSLMRSLISDLRKAVRQDPVHRVGGTAPVRSGRSVRPGKRQRALWEAIQNPCLEIRRIKSALDAAPYKTDRARGQAAFLERLQALHQLVMALPAEKLSVDEARWVYYKYFRRAVPGDRDHLAGANESAFAKMRGEWRLWKSRCVPFGVTDVLGIDVARSDTKQAATSIPKVPEITSISQALPSMLPATTPPGLGHSVEYLRLGQTLAGCLSNIQRLGTLAGQALTLMNEVAPELTGESLRSLASNFMLNAYRHIPPEWRTEQFESIRARWLVGEPGVSFLTLRRFSSSELFEARRRKLQACLAELFRQGRILDTGVLSLIESIDRSVTPLSPTERTGLAPGLRVVLPHLSDALRAAYDEHFRDLFPLASDHSEIGTDSPFLASSAADGFLLEQSSFIPDGVGHVA